MVPGPCILTPSLEKGIELGHPKDDRESQLERGRGCETDRHSHLIYQITLLFSFPLLTILILLFPVYPDFPSCFPSLLIHLISSSCFAKCPSCSQPFTLPIPSKNWFSFRKYVMGTLSLPGYSNYIYPIPSKKFTQADDNGIFHRLTVVSLIHNLLF